MTKAAFSARSGDSSGSVCRLPNQLRKSPELQPVFLTITFVPDTDAGKRFCDQFLSNAEGMKIRYGSAIAMRNRVFRKKARMMAHWAVEIGVRLAVEE